LLGIGRTYLNRRIIYHFGYIGTELRDGLEMEWEKFKIHQGIREQGLVGELAERSDQGDQELLEEMRELRDSLVWATSEADYLAILSTIFILFIEGSGRPAIDFEVYSEILMLSEYGLNQEYYKAAQDLYRKFKIKRAVMKVKRRIRDWLNEIIRFARGIDKEYPDEERLGVLQKRLSAFETRNVMDRVGISGNFVFAYLDDKAIKARWVVPNLYSIDLLWEEYSGLVVYLVNGRHVRGYGVILPNSGNREKNTGGDHENGQHRVKLLTKADSLETAREWLHYSSHFTRNDHRAIETYQAYDHVLNSAKAVDDPSRNAEVAETRDKVHGLLGIGGNYTEDDIEIFLEIADAIHHGASIPEAIEEIDMSEQWQEWALTQWEEEIPALLGSMNGSSSSPLSQTSSPVSIIKSIIKAIGAIIEFFERINDSPQLAEVKKLEDLFDKHYGDILDHMTRLIHWQEHFYLEQVEEASKAIARELDAIKSHMRSEAIIEVTKWINSGVWIKLERRSEAGEIILRLELLDRRLHILTEHLQFKIYVLLSNYARTKRTIDHIFVRHRAKLDNTPKIWASFNQLNDLAYRIANSARDFFETELHYDMIAGQAEGNIHVDTWEENQERLKGTIDAMKAKVRGHRKIRYGAINQYIAEILRIISRLQEAFSQFLYSVSQRDIEYTRNDK